MKKVIILGIWDEAPIIVWPWFCDLAVDHFKKLTGFHLHSFTYMRKGLHHQGFLTDDVDQVFKKFKNFPPKQKLMYVKKICCDYYHNAKKAENFLSSSENINYKRASDQELTTLIKKWSRLMPLTSLSIWLVVFLDLWYPFLTEKAVWKKIGIKARNHSGLFHEKSNGFLGKILKEIAHRKKITFRNIYFLFPGEIVELIKNGKISTPLISQRKKLCVTTNFLGHYQIYQSVKAKSLLKNISQTVKEQKPTDSFKGFPVQPGLVKGTVRVILKCPEFKKFRKGEILVALQTLVNYVPIMKKSKAILTEFGGITSHAAVVSRELKKPCIVGIKNLTASLKTGDRVEVDANKGLVKKLPKSAKIT